MVPRLPLCIRTSHIIPFSMVNNTQTWNLTFGHCERGWLAENWAALDDATETIVKVSLCIPDTRGFYPLSRRSAHPPSLGTSVAFGCVFPVSFHPVYLLVSNYGG